MNIRLVQRPIGGHIMHGVAQHMLTAALWTLSQTVKRLVFRLTGQRFCSVMFGDSGTAQLTGKLTGVLKFEKSLNFRKACW